MACGILLDARVEHETDSRLRSGIPSAAGRSDVGEENSIVSRRTKFENRQLFRDELVLLRDLLQRLAAETQAEGR